MEERAQGEEKKEDFSPQRHRKLRGGKRLLVRGESTRNWNQAPETPSSP
jgi:hypothetical protein